MLWSPCATTAESVCCSYWACVPRACAQQQKKPPQWEARTLQLETSPNSPQLEKALVQQTRPSAAINKKKEGKKEGHPKIALAFTCLTHLDSLTAVSSHSWKKNHGSATGGISKTVKYVSNCVAPYFWTQVSTFLHSRLEVCWNFAWITRLQLGWFSFNQWEAVTKHLLCAEYQTMTQSRVLTGAKDMHININHKSVVAEVCF